MKRLIICLFSGFNHHRRHGNMDLSPAWRRIHPATINLTSFSSVYFNLLLKPL